MLFVFILRLFIYLFNKFIYYLKYKVEIKILKINGKNIKLE